ncbi:hypothetical protein BGZ63DRAFT_392168 [Mariannaea sp. PMI_226]|nr:hypothetical protein BGZ63DRAFT_392168 [Mariannaea sp. PMI_226]
MMAFAFPDQCQMLLNKANALFFQNTVDSKSDAYMLYGRLTKRLSFWPALLASLQARSKNPVDNVETPLGKSYSHLEYVLQVTLSATEQLQSIYSQAMSFGNQIITGSDMFGHDPTWVPRLNSGYYTTEISDYLDTLKAVERAYKNALGVKASLSDISTGQTAAASGVQRAQYRIDLLTDDNGPLVSSADTIARYTPLLKAKVQECKDNMAIIAADIQAHINIDPLDILSGLSMVAMAPTLPLALVEGAKVLYNANTTIQDNTGATIKTSYVISELGEAGSTLSSVATGFSTRADLSIEADDPGGLKLLATADQITLLYTKFKADIPDRDGAALSASLTDLQSLVMTRNNAVITYNNSIELLQQAIVDKAYYTKQQQAYSDDAAKSLNPGLPSILLWLRRTKDSYALETMRLLNYANRAIAYWGLVSPISFASPGPLQDSQTLSIAKLSLEQSAETAITAFAGSAPSYFPVTGRQGALYKLNRGQIFSLQNPLKSSVTGDTYYSVIIKLIPGIQDDSQDLPLFAGRANVRLDLIRLWLIGASVSPNKSGEMPISIVITQLGSEVMQNDRRAAFNFQHDSVTIPFVFDSDGVEALKDCNNSRVLNKQFLSNYYVGVGDARDSSIAAIGPWATWAFEIRENENKDLNMERLTEAYIEFGGYCSPFKVSGSSHLDNRFV